MDINVITLTGRLCESPELKQTTTGKSVTSVTTAVDRPSAKDTTDFIPITVWNQSAEYLCKYGSKGAMVALSGKLTTRKYEDKNGNKRTAFEVMVDNIRLCGNSKESSTEAKNEAPAQPYVPTPYSTGNSQNFESISDDADLPF